MSSEAEYNSRSSLLSVTVCVCGKVKGFAGAGSTAHLPAEPRNIGDEEENDGAIALWIHMANGR